MKTLAIIGAGGHAKVVADAALKSEWENIVFFDDKWPALDSIGNWKIKGNIQAFLTQLSQFDGVIVAIGNNAVRLEKINYFLNKNIPLATIIHPSAVISPYAKVEKGSVIFANAVLNPFCHAGLGSIINTGAILEHDCELGNGVHISPGAKLAGNVHVGNLSWIGIGSSVRQDIRIGNEVIIGAGAVVICDIPNNCTAVGVPAKIQYKKEKM